MPVQRMNGTHKTIAKNGKRVPASEKGKAKGRKSPGSVTANGKTADLDDAEGVAAVCAEAVSGAVRAEKVDVSTGEVTDPNSIPLLRLTITTDIGKICDPKGPAAHQAVAILPRSPDEVYLAATDGHMAAAVTADREAVGDVEAAGLHAAWLPRDMATSPKSEGRTLRLAKGSATTLFGDGVKWVDDREGWFQEVPDGGAFPDLAGILPTDVDGMVCIGMNAALLATLARAVNNADVGDVVTLFIRPGKGGEASSSPIVAVGNKGVGLLVPYGTNRELSAKLYAAHRRSLAGTRRPKPAAPDPDRGTLEPTPPDAAQQVPSNAKARPDPVDADPPHPEPTPDVAPPRLKRLDNLETQLLHALWSNCPKDGTFAFITEGYRVLLTAEDGARIEKELRSREATAATA